MTSISPATNGTDLDLLLQLTLAPEKWEQPVSYVAGLDDAGRGRLLALADANHVVIRAFRVIAEHSTTNPDLARSMAAMIAVEEARIDNALTFLHHVCDELEQGGCPVAVMKSLDHWPDLGSDLDLYTTADPQQVLSVMTRRLGAHIEARSWGDRLANKWNFTYSRAAGVRRDPRPAPGTDRRASGDGQALRLAPHAQDGERPHLPGAGAGGAHRGGHACSACTGIFISGCATS